MLCEPEPENRHDHYAVIVKAPTNVPEGVRNLEMRGAPNQQYVRDILGTVIGHVPRNVCNVISVSVNIHRTLQHAVCFYTGEIEHGASGPKLNCMYLLEFDQSINLSTVGNYLKRYMDPNKIYL